MRSHESPGHTPTLRAVYDDALESLRRPVPVQAARRGKVAAGVFAVAGSAAILFGWGSAAEAKTATSAAYAVKKGDTLSKIASDHGVSIDALAAANGITPRTVIVTGKQLTLPGHAKAPGSSGYTIKSGDTLERIARAHNVSIDSLASANGLKRTSILTIGKPLVIPPGGAAPAPAAVVAATAPKPGTPEAKKTDVTKQSGHTPADLPANSERFKLRPEFQRAASEHGVPVSLLQAVAWNESGWQNNVVSNVGARGIGQIMPDTAAHITERLTDKSLDPNNPADNIQMSAIYLRYLINETRGDYKLALAAYYQGLASVRERGQYEDTKKYVATVLALQKNHFG
jgi:LysM repeat protein